MSASLFILRVYLINQIVMRMLVHSQGRLTDKNVVHKVILRIDTFGRSFGEATVSLFYQGYILFGYGRLLAFFFLRRLTLMYYCVVAQKMRRKGSRGSKGGDLLRKDTCKDRYL